MGSFNNCHTFPMSKCVVCNLFPSFIIGNYPVFTQPNKAGGFVATNSQVGRLDGRAAG